MKDINGNDLQQPYYDLAVMRREKTPDSRYNHGFSWGNSPESPHWWLEVYSLKYPPIPQRSLDELDAWRRSKHKEILDAFNQPADTTDWKAKYEEILDKLEFYKKAFEGFKETVAQNTPTAELTAEPSNFIAECAMRAMQGMLSNPSFMDEQDGYYTLKHEHTVASLAFDYAEAMAAEGKKRGHLPNTENDNA